jgi:hypothetical protein
VMESFTCGMWIEQFFGFFRAFFQFNTNNNTPTPYNSTSFFFATCFYHSLFFLLLAYAAATSAAIGLTSTGTSVHSVSTNSHS